LKYPLKERGAFDIENYTLDYKNGAMLLLLVHVLRSIVCHTRTLCEEIYLDTIRNLVGLYEDQYHAIPTTTDSLMLHYLMEIK
jgi:hypothetical protein